MTVVSYVRAAFQILFFIFLRAHSARAWNSRLREIANGRGPSFSGKRLAFQRILLLTLAHALLAFSALATCNAPKNAIEAENCLPGNPPSQWYVSGTGSTNIQGFSTDISVNAGQTVVFKISTTAVAYRIDIYRMGYYLGQGARLVASISPSATLPQIQPACLTDSSTGLTDCGNWAISASWAVPTTATSGIYQASLVRLDTGEIGQILFVVRNDSSHSDILVQTSDLNWQAYNNYGGNSLYSGNPAGRAYKVSYNRPFNVPNLNAWFFASEYPMLRWLEANGYDVTYFSGVDTDRNGALIKQHKIFMPVGHDEYWSGGQRTNTEAARAAGVNLAFFSGNEIYWKTRWEPSIDGTNTAYRTLVCYKETLANAVIDPADPPIWTGIWRDPRFSPPADGGRPENALTGTLFGVSSPRNDPITVPQADGRMRFWRNTSIASLASGQVATLPAGVLGYEWDVDTDNGFRPAGLVPLSTTTLNVSTCVMGYTIASCTATHQLTLYRASSGALVFGAGTVQWSWGLDSNHAISGTPTDVNMQQATVNLLADMGVQPATLQGGLVPASASTDTTPPRSTITSPATGTRVSAGSSLTVSGTAVDSGGGVVGAVEVSLDGGKTWHPATGRENWSYQATFGFSGTLNVLSRAVDDSGNIETPGPGVTVTAAPQNCPCTIWSSAAAPGTADAGSYSPLELGVQFHADTDGYITGVRFYKSAANTGTHVGHLWSNSGALLASAPFTNESPSGWQQVNFSNPVAIAANNLYVASYQTSVGHFSLDQGYFTTFGVDNAPLHASADISGYANGLYAFTSSPAFPANTLNASNYWVDAVFNYKAGAGSTLGVSTASLPNGTQSVAYNQSLAATSGTIPYHWSLISGALPPGLALSASGNISGTPAAVGTSGFTVQVTDSSTPQQAATQPLSITIVGPGGAQPNAQLIGNYAFRFSGMTGNSSASSTLAAVGRFTADGGGNLTNGEMDINAVGGGTAAQSLTGTYSIGADNRGMMTLNLPGGSTKLAFAMLANGNALFIEFDASGGAGTIGSGTIEKADAGSFSTASIAGDYAFGAAGSDNANNRAAIEGRFTSNGTGVFTNAAGDLNGYGTDYAMNFTTASYAVSDTSTGRGAMNLSFTFGGIPASLNFVFYVVNSGKLFVMESDPVTTATPLLNGSVLQQQTPTTGFSNSSLSGNMVIYLTGLSLCGSGPGVPKAVAGLLTTNGNGGLSLTYDENYCHAPNSVSGAAGTYSVASNGRAAITIGGYNLVAYLVNSDQMILFVSDANVLFGYGEPQSVTTFTNGALEGLYGGYATNPVGFGVNVFSGEFSADGGTPTGNFTGVEDIGASSGTSPGTSFHATYSISPSPTNGRGTMTINSGAGGTAVIYMISPTKFVAVPLSDPNPAVWDFEQSPNPVPAISLSSLSLIPASVTGGNSSTGTATVSGPAPSGGAQISLSSNNPGVAIVPSSVTIAAGATSATFNISTATVSASTAVTISAIYAGVTQSAGLTITPAPPPPPKLASLSLNPSSVVGGVQSSTGTVTLTGPAPAGGAQVSLSSSNGAASVPSSVLIPAGATSSTFQVSTSIVLVSTSAAISAIYNGTTQTETLAVTF
ncbi:MAG TPA: N,N-dimethylformamidase beta subunit family domain-containing protein [Candidatus Sulfotelmatobacter sp.]|jgi:hypothetical protein|nr:N,N-dimethylformamidase beta subunit family domain-containing protein [Candidatus Sulfotelmatobacter sp.]